MPRHTRSLPAHPGALLRDVVLPGAKISKTEVAERLHISRASLYDILNEKAAVTPEMAVRLGRLFGNGPDLWINMQTKRDIARAERDLAETPIEAVAGTDTTDRPGRSAKNKAA